MKNFRNLANLLPGVQTAPDFGRKRMSSLVPQQVSGWLAATFIFTVSLGFKVQGAIKERSPQPLVQQPYWRPDAIEDRKLQMTAGDAGIPSPALLTGQQNAITNHGIGLCRDRVDTGEVRPRQRGYFRFYHVKLSAILRELERWYDVEVIYTECVENRTYVIGRIPRSEKITKPLTIMALTGSIQYWISKDGKTVYISK